MDNLLPCPFCGGEAKFLSDMAGYGNVFCTDCLARINYQYQEKADTIAEWNTRVDNAELTRLREQLEAANKRADAAVEILKTIAWVGSGAKGRIDDAIGILCGEKEEKA